MKALVIASFCPSELSHLKISEDKTQLNWQDLSYELSPADEITLQVALKKYGNNVYLLNIGRACEQEAAFYCYGLGVEKIFRVEVENDFSTEFVVNTSTAFIDKDLANIKEIFIGNRSGNFASGQVANKLKEKYPELVTICNGHSFPKSEFKIPSFREMMIAKEKEIFKISYNIEDKNFKPTEFFYVPQKAKCEIFTEKQIESFAKKLIYYSTQSILNNKVFDDKCYCFSGRLLSTYNNYIPDNEGERQKNFICGGLGILPFKNWSLLQNFANSLNAKLYCTKPLYDQGLLPPEMHAGQTGKNLSGRLYVGVGVSGALQHISGIMACNKIAAINTDASAPIISYADIALIGDAKILLPKLTEIINKNK